MIVNEFLIYPAHANLHFAFFCGMYCRCLTCRSCCNVFLSFFFFTACKVLSCFVCRVFFEEAFCQGALWLDVHLLQSPSKKLYYLFNGILSESLLRANKSRRKRSRILFGISTLSSDFACSISGCASYVYSFRFSYFYFLCFFFFFVNFWWWKQYCTYSVRMSKYLSSDSCGNSRLLRGVRF